MEIRSGGDAVCVRCGDGLAAPDVDDLCRACRMTPPPFERAVAYGPYDGRMRDAIHALKYDRLHPAAQVLGKVLAAAVAQLAGQAPAEMLVTPVPLHRRKLNERGFNQARLLAAEALRELGRTHPAWKLTLADSLVLRTRPTASQAGLTPRQRRLNVRTAFKVRDAAAVAGRDILIVDDILTTGATARAASKVLLDAGTKSVWVATLARARRPFFAPQGGIAEQSEIQGNGDYAAPLYAEGMHTAANQPSL